MQDNESQFSQAVISGSSVMRIENETMQQFSINKPRAHPEIILKNIFAELEAEPEFAERAYYVLAYKKHANDPDNAPKVKIEGISIKGAQQMKRLWGNCTSGSRLVAQDERFVHVQGVAIDYETNTREAREWVIPKFEIDPDTKHERAVRQSRLVVMIQAHMSKAERNALLMILPEPLKAKYFQKAKEIAARHIGIKAHTGTTTAETKPQKPLKLSQRIKKMFDKMEEIGAQEEKVLKFLGVKKRSQITEDNIGTMIGVYNSVMDGEAKLDEILGGGKKELQTVGEKQAATLFDQQPEKKDAKKKD